MKFEEWLAKNEELFGSPYEKLFAINVLAIIGELDFAAIHSQFGFKDVEGKARYCDFVLQEGETVKIAIEIDGYDKRGSGSGMSREDFVDWQRRQAALVSQGWSVLRFANTDVRDHPELCRQHVELLLRCERKKSIHRAYLEEQILSLSRQFDEIQNHTEFERSKLTELIERLQDQLDTRPLTPDEVIRLQELNDVQSKNGILKEENAVMKTTIWAFTALLAVIIVTFGFKMGSVNSTKTQISQPQEILPVTEQQAEAVYQTKLEKQKVTKIQNGLPVSEQPESDDVCNNAVNWSKAKQYIGERISIQGPVVRVTQRQDVQGSPTWIEIGTAYPSENRLTLVIWGDYRPAFEPAISGQLQSRLVCVKGIVKQYRELPQIELQSPEQWVLK